MAEFNHSIIRVAVWNLAGFGKPGASDTTTTPSRRSFRQAQGLALMDAEFVTLVEVSPFGYLDELADNLSNFGLEYKRTIIEQPHGKLHIGFLHKPGITVTNARLIDGSEGDSSRARRAIAVDIEVGKLKATVIGVHLKAGRDAEDQKLRDSQCKAIGQFITTLQQTPGSMRKPIFMMGDFNMIPGQDVSNFHHLGGDDVMDFVSSWDLQERFSHILEKGRANLLDGFAISRRFSTRYIRGSLRLFPMHWTMNLGREAYRTQVSDHLPFVASFRLY
jgi:endonuclease/exonuclease/phosphatase family metal-dependent hydrolase